MARSTPVDYGQLFDWYFEYIKRIVSRNGIQEQDVEDVASEILVRFIDKDYLTKFEEGRWFDTPDGRKQSRFQGYLASIVGKYVLNYRDKQRLSAEREPVRNEMPVQGHDGSAAMWIEVYAPAVEGGYEVIESQLVHDGLVREAVEVLSRCRSRSRVPLSWVFTKAVEQIERSGRVSRWEMAQEAGVSDTTIGVCFREMQRVLHENGLPVAV